MALEPAAPPDESRVHDRQQRQHAHIEQPGLLCAVCLNWLSFRARGPGSIVHKSTVEACAAYPQREGTAHDIWSRPIRSVTGTMPPQSTNCNIRETSSGMICSLEWAREDRTRPIVAAVTHIAAVATYSSRVALPRSSAAASVLPSPES